MTENKSKSNDEQDEVEESKHNRKSLHNQKTLKTCNSTKDDRKENWKRPCA